MEKKTREILFRGKCIETGRWVYGSFVMDGTELTAIEKSRKPLATWGFIRRYNAEMGKVEMFEVERETVGQYTGLICSYGKHSGEKIFEGDIVRHLNDSPYAEESISEIGRVFWDDEYCGWRRTSNGAFYHGNIDTYRLSQKCCYEVIGNIYDNHELIESVR